MSEIAGNWMRSSFCSDHACIEVATLDGDVVIRDSKDLSQPFLRFSKAEWHAFLDSVNAGEMMIQRE
jgi:hypothetical protein